VSTSKKPQINNAQYLRIPSRILKGASNEQVVEDVVAEVWNVQVWLAMKPKRLLIYFVWSVETPRYPA
jgi:ribose 5-phosphate isomerase RpiB